MLYYEKPSSLKIAIIFIVGLFIASLAGYGFNLFINPPAEHVEDITLKSFEIREAEDTELLVKISNSDSREHSYTITIETDPIITLSIGDTKLTAKNSIYTHSFQADPGDLITKKFIVHSGSLQPPKTSVTSNITIKIYVENELEPTVERGLQITVKK